MELLVYVDHFMDGAQATQLGGLAVGQSPTRLEGATSRPTTGQAELRLRTIHGDPLVTLERVIERCFAGIGSGSAGMRLEYACSEAELWVEIGPGFCTPSQVHAALADLLGRFRVNGDRIVNATVAAANRQPGASH